MFYILLFLDILTAVGLGVWFAMRHGEEYYRLLKNSRNVSLAMNTATGEEFYDTEQVNESEIADEGLCQDPVIAEECGAPLSGEDFSAFTESAMPETGNAEDTSLEIADKDIAIPEGEVISEPLDDPESYGITMIDQENEVGEGTEIISEQQEMSESISEFPNVWGPSVRIEEIVQTTSCLSKETTHEFLPVLNELQGIYELFADFTEEMRNQEDAEVHLTPAETKYVSRIICRPKLVTKKTKICH